MIKPVFADIELARLNYKAIQDSATDAERADMKAFLAEVLPNEWIYAYEDTSPQRHNVHEIQLDNFNYLWDLSYELVTKGLIPKEKYVDDRVIAAHGCSADLKTPRNDSRLRGYSTGPIGFVGDENDPSKVDRGHLIGHALGGVLDLNVIPQLRSMNRGGDWRKMENYCAANPGTYFFCRPIYLGYSRQPAEIEFGILNPDDSLWVESFQNYKDLAELESIEIAWLEKIQSLASEESGGGLPPQP